MDNKKKILIVEDEILIASYIKKLLEDEGYNVLDLIGSGKLAFEKAIELKPDLILIDISLNDNVSGINAAEVIQCHHIPYRAALCITYAIAEITDNKHVLYDGNVVDACIKVINKKGFNFDELN